MVKLSTSTKQFYRYFGLLAVVILGVISILGSGGSGGDGTPPPPTGPSVIGVSPLQNSDTGLVTTEVTARFSESMAPKTINTNSFVVWDGTKNITSSVVYFTQYGGYDNVAVLNPTNDLEIGKEYIATLTTEITDTDSEPLSNDYVWSFFIAPSPVAVSNNAAGIFGNTGIDTLSPSMPNATGEYVVFASTDNLAGISTGGSSQIYRKHTISGKVEVVSSNNNGDLANADCASPRISDTGRYVVFASRANNLDLSFTDQLNYHIYLKDMKPGITDSITLLDVNKDDSTQPANGSSNMPDISGIPDVGSGKYVVFQSTATNLHPGDTDDISDIFLINVVSGAVELVSVDSVEVKGTADSFAPRVSENGRRIVFESLATDLVTDDSNGKSDIFLRNFGSDSTSSTDDDTFRISVDSNGDEVSGGTDGSKNADISADGVYTVFQSDQPTLDGKINNSKTDIFIRETNDASTIKTLSLADGDADGANGHSERPSISADGRYITFESEATDLVASDTNGAVLDIFVRERNSTTISLLSVDNNNTQGNQDSINAVISANGRYVSFTTSNNLDTADGNGTADIYRAYNAEYR